VTAPPIPAQRTQEAFCLCGAPVANLLTDNCGHPSCVALSNVLDRLENRDDD
jgi:hypothetical protein